MALVYRYGWLFLLLIQMAWITYFFLGRSNSFGIYNQDAFSYHVQWSKAAGALNPFREPVLQDPGHDLLRLPFSMPHFFLGLTTRMLPPFQSYLIWCLIGVLLNYFSLYWFARSVEFSKNAAVLAALVHYTFFHILSQLPPLSFNQASYIYNALQLDPETLLHFGPKQYPHDIFFYPLLFSLLALTIAGVRKLKVGMTFPWQWLTLWGVLCVLLPFNYFYHWLEFGLTLGLVFIAGFTLKWWRVRDFFGKYLMVFLVMVIVGAIWCAVIVFQSSQLSTPVGSRFALMGGLTEARFLLLPPGILLRVGMWCLILVVCLRLRSQSVILCIFLLSTIFLMNIQLITGKNIQPGHWSFGIDRIFCWILIIAFYFKVLPVLKQPIRNILAPATFALSLLFFCVQSYVSWKSFVEYSRWDRDRVALIEYLNSLPPKVLLIPEIWLETDILIHTKHFGFLPRAAQSAIDAHEHLHRLTHAALLLSYSREGFYRWIHTRAVRFFGMLYGTEKEFSSSLYFDPVSHPEVMKFGEGRLPAWDEKLIEEYIKSPCNLTKKLDLIVQHNCEEVPASVAATVYENRKYRVIAVEVLRTKAWGTNTPIAEQKYPLYQTTCHTKEK